MDARLETLLEWRKLYFAELAELKKTALDGIDYQAKFVAEARCEYIRCKLAFLQRRRNERLAEWRAERTAAALAAAEAEVARLRAALDKFTTSILTTPSYLPEALWGAHIAAENARASVGLPAIVDEEANHENG